MSTLADIDPSVLYCLFKGEPGTRKSTAALSFPRPQYWFSFDQKMESLLLPMDAWKIPINEITFDDYTDWNSAHERLKVFEQSCFYKTLILDSVTSIGDATNAQTLDSKMEIKVTTQGEQSRDTGKKIGGIPVNTIEDFNAETSVFQRILKLTKKIHKKHKVNIVIIAHVIQTEMKTLDGKTSFSRTLITGAKKIPGKIVSQCAEVYHFNIKTGFVVGGSGTYEILTTHTGDDFARTALPLSSSIDIGDQPLYTTYLTPAIVKLKQAQEKAKQLSQTK